MTTFSRAFAAFAEDQLPQRIQDALIKKHYGDKIAGHINRDGTAVDGREKAAKKTPKAITLPPRQKTKNYVRPPITEQNFVPKVY